MLVLPCSTLLPWLQGLDLKIGETQELTLWAFPKAAGPAQDVVVCRISDNPVPVEFPVSCVGAKPQVEVRLDMPAPPEGEACGVHWTAAGVSYGAKFHACCLSPACMQ